MNTAEYNSSRFNRTYRKFKQLVFDTAMYYSDGDYHTSEEVLQEVFVKCYLYEIYEQDDDRIEAWLRVVTENSMRDIFRKRKREVLQDEVTEDMFIDEFDSMDTRYVAEEEQLQIEQCVNGLLDALYEKNPRWHDVLVMRFFFEQKEEDIAKSMGVSHSAVRSIMKRAKAWLNKYHKPKL